MNNQRFCPICKNKNNNLLLQKKGFNIVKCKKCSHVFVSNPNEDTSSPFNNDININGCHTRHFQIINQLKKHFTNKKGKIKIAEIGSGYGYLAKLLSYENDLFEYYGFEPSIGRADFCKSYGLNVINELFQVSENKYDAIIVDNVLEHVSEPDYIFDIASQSLIKGGAFIVIVPNLYDLRRFIKKWKDKHYWQPNCHISYFSFSDLEKLSSKYNMLLRDFTLSSLPNNSSLFLKIKTILDTIGLHIGGLYTYAIKQ